MRSNTDLRAKNATVEWIVILGSRDQEYLIYQVFRQKYLVWFWFWIRYQVFGIWYYTAKKRLFSRKSPERIIPRALSCIIPRIRLVRWFDAKLQEDYNSLTTSYKSSLQNNVIKVTTKIWSELTLQKKKKKKEANTHKYNYDNHVASWCS